MESLNNVELLELKDKKFALFLPTKFARPIDFVFDFIIHIDFLLYYFIHPTLFFAIMHKKINYY